MDAVPPVVDVATLHERVDAILRRAGLNAVQSGAVARVIVAAQRDACTAHGVYRIEGLLRTIKAGKVVPDAVPALLPSQVPAVVRVDARGGFANAALELGVPALVERARTTGRAAVEAFAGLGTALAADVAVLSPLAKLRQLDGAFPAGAHYAIRTRNLATFTPDAVSTLLDAYAARPTPGCFANVLPEPAGPRRPRRPRAGRRGLRPEHRPAARGQAPPRPGPRPHCDAPAGPLSGGTPAGRPSPPRNAAGGPTPADDLAVRVRSSGGMLLPGVGSVTDR